MRHPGPKPPGTVSGDRWWFAAEAEGALDQVELRHHKCSSRKSRVGADGHDRHGPGGAAGPPGKRQGPGVPPAGPRLAVQPGQALPSGRLTSSRNPELLLSHQFALYLLDGSPALHRAVFPAPSSGHRQGPGCGSSSSSGWAVSSAPWLPGLAGEGLPVLSLSSGMGPRGLPQVRLASLRAPSEL